MKGKISPTLKKILDDPQARKHFSEVMEGERDCIEHSDGTLYIMGSVITGERYGSKPETKNALSDDSCDTIEYLVND